MNPTHVLSYRRRIESVIALAKNTPDDEVRAHLAAYACVLLCGFLEVAIRAALLRHAEAQAGPRVVRYSEANLGYFYNPTVNRILDLLETFDPEWATRLRSSTDDQTKDGVNSIVANKNNIVHGKSVGVTIVRAERYYESAKRLLLTVEELCS
jgi:hypothetical protein